MFRANPRRNSAQMSPGQTRRKAAREARRKYLETGVIAHLDVTSRTRGTAGGEGVAKTKATAPLPIDPHPHVIVPRNAILPGVQAVVLGPCLNKRLIYVVVEGQTRDRHETATLPRNSPPFSRGARIRVERGRDGRLVVCGRYTRFGMLVPQYERPNVLGAGNQAVAAAEPGLVEPGLRSEGGDAAPVRDSGTALTAYGLAVGQALDSPGAREEGSGVDQETNL